MTQKWLKDPAPGQFRGEGEWRRVEDNGLDRNFYEHCRRTGFLPVREQANQPEPDET